MLETLAGAAAQQTTRCHLRQQCQTLSKINILLQYILAGEGGGGGVFCFVLFCSWLFNFCNCLLFPALSQRLERFTPSSASCVLFHVADAAHHTRCSAPVPPSCFPCLLPASSAEFTALEWDFWINMHFLFLKNALFWNHSCVKIY